MSGSDLLNHRYEIISKLGEGGMGVVYRARDHLTGNLVALKRVMLQGDVESLRLTLAHEFQLMASLRHPHIISVLDYGFDDERTPFYTMTLLDEPRTITEAATDLPLPTRIQLLVQFYQALAYLHRRGILHRDLKPSNVLVTAENTVKVLDFGVAQSLQAGDTRVAGTIMYMAPETLQERPPSIQADLYAAGIVSYEVLKGRHPYADFSTPDLIRAILTDLPDFTDLPTLVEKDLVQTLYLAPRQAAPPPQEADTEADTEALPPPAPAPTNPLAIILNRLLQKEPAQRYPDADVVVDDLRASIGMAAHGESRDIRESFLQAADFVGRDREMAMLYYALEQITDEFGSKQGSAFLIGGESGAGKSRLLDELRIRAMLRGALVLTGQGIVGGAQRYNYWREALRRLILSTTITDLEAGILKAIVPDIDKLLGRPIEDAPPANDGRSDQVRLVETMVETFRRQELPIVLILEDLQWAKESLTPLKRVLEIVKENRLLVLGSYRNDEAPELPKELPGMQLLTLQRLKPEAIEALSVSILGEGGRRPDIQSFLQRESEGNVLFIVETVRALAEEAGRLRDISTITLPNSIIAGGVQEVLRRRLSRLPSTEYHMLKMASVGGRLLRLDVLKYLFAKHFSLSLEAWLNTCSETAILEVRDELWQFQHDKLREYVYDELSESERQSFHKQTALAFEAVYDAIEEHAVALSIHWRGAGDVQKEAHYSFIVAQRAYENSHFAFALETAERAAKLLADSPTADLSKQAELFHLIGLVYEDQGEFKRAIDHYYLALDIARRLDDQEAIARELGGMGNAESNLGDNQNALQHLLEARRLIENVDNPRLLADIINSTGTVYQSQGHHEEAARYFRESKEQSEQIQHTWGVARALNNLGNALWDMDDLPGAIDHYKQSLVIWRELGSRRGIAITLNNLGVLADAQEDYAAAKEYYAESLRMAREHNDSFNIAVSLINLAWTNLHLKTPAPAYQQLVEALRRSHDMGVNILQLYSIAGLCWVNMVQDAEQMAEIFGMLLAHPDAAPEAEHFLDVAAQLESALAPDVYAKALERGKTLAFDRVIDDILASKRLLYVEAEEE